MNSLRKTAKNICLIEESALKNGWLNRRHPLAKLIVTFCYALTVTSVHKYSLLPLLLLALYPAALFLLSRHSFRQMFSSLKVIFFMSAFLGAGSLFFDAAPIPLAAHLTVTGGAISFFSLTLKGILTIAASYLLMASTTIQGICSALKILRVPIFFLTQILLMYRYLTVILHTAADMQDSYALRSPFLQGIKPSHWGTFAGQLLLHSLARAETIYQSMLLRGYTPEKFFAAPPKFAPNDFLYLFLSLCFFLFAKYIPHFFLG